MTLSAREAAVAWATCLQEGDFKRLVGLHHENLVCNLLGTSRVSGRYHGRDAFFSHTIQNVMGVMAVTDEVYLKGYKIVCADERYSVMLLHGGLPTQAGGRYDQNYLQVFRVDGGLITQTHELLDTVMLETEVFGKRLARQPIVPREPLAPAMKYPGTQHPVAPADADRIEREFSAALLSADRAACVALLHPESVLQIAGSTPASGTIRGRDLIDACLASYVEAHFKPRSLRVDSNRLACRDSGGFCRLARVSGELLDGRPYSQTIGIAGCFANDAIVEVYLYFDTAEEERQVFDNPLSGGTQDTSPEPFSIFESSP